MRIVAVADTHNFHDDLGRLPDGDLLIHAGDLCGAGELFELRRAAAWLQALPHCYKIVIAGNHDFCFEREPQESIRALGPGITYLQDSEAVVDGVRIWGSPWQPEFCDWAFNLPRGRALAEKWALIPDGIDILVTHGPPHGYGDHCFDGRREGCEDLLLAIRRVRPLLHVFGHIHEDGGVWRDSGFCIANVTTWDGGRGPTVFDLDLSARSVKPITVPPARYRT